MDSSVLNCHTTPLDLEAVLAGAVSQLGLSPKRSHSLGSIEDSWGWDVVQFLAVD